MKSNYPFISQEIKNIILEGYSNLVYLLGYENDGYDHFSGLYEYLYSSGNNFLINQSGIQNINTNSIINMLKYDYLYRKNNMQIQYKEKH